MNVRKILIVLLFIPFIIMGQTVYIVGESYNSDGEWGACYWVDGVRVELPGGYIATDIVVSNGNVYTSGSADDACYWINQTRYDLPGNGGEGEAIAVDGNDVYVAGWWDNGSCYWKNGERIDLTTNAESQAFALGIRNNGAIYVGGYYMNNNHYYIPCFWKNGNNRHVLPIPSGGDGEVYDIAFMDGNMRYYAGYVLKTSSFAGYTPTAVYWRHTTRTDLPLGGSTFDIYGAGAYGITIDGDDVYIAGYTDWFEDTNNPYTTGGSFPQYWKNSTIYDLEGGPMTNFGTGLAYDIGVADGNVVVVGVATRDTSYFDSQESACYWLNGELHYLVNQYDVPEGTEGWEWSAARGVTVVGTLSIDGADIPEVFALHQNYPNPFNPITTLRYDLPEQSMVNIIIYDLLGRQVRTLINQTQDAGFKSVIWDATNDYGKPVSAGVYLYKIQAEGFIQTKKMVLLK